MAVHDLAKESISAGRAASDRLRLALCVIGPVLSLGALLRVVLFVRFHEASEGLAALVGAVLIGASQDLLISIPPLLPVWWAVVLGSSRLLACRPLLGAVMVPAYSGLCLFAVVEYLFFREFTSRLNYVAFDYLVYPTEVFVNLRQSFDIPRIVIGIGVAGVLMAALALRALRGASFPPIPAQARWRTFGVVTIVALCCWPVLLELSGPMSPDRVTSEIARNGLFTFAVAAITGDLDFLAHYKTMPPDGARLRAARVLGFFDVSPALSDPATPRQAQLEAAAEAMECGRQSGALHRHIGGSRPIGARPLDVVVIFEESLGSEYVGALEGTPGLTPNLDRWTSEGLFFTRTVATGSRTIRGLEAVLCSFVPLPGDALIRRASGQAVTTLATVFRTAGYRTEFFYGGQARFDGMKMFALANGFERFTDENEFPRDAFRTAWGVADEYIFDALLERQKSTRARGERLFATLLSVSNHRPFHIPESRIGTGTGKPNRHTAVRYADWALGRYLDRARADGLLEHTLVLIVGDHGPRVYGSELIPIKSYRVPALFLTPDRTWRGQRDGQLCSQIDLGPTLIGLSGVMLLCGVGFQGTDLLGHRGRTGRAFVQHNRDVGLLTEDHLVVLGLNRVVTCYRRTGPTRTEFEEVPVPRWGSELRDLVDDTVAVYQTAYELFRSGDLGSIAHHRCERGHVR